MIDTYLLISKFLAGEASVTEITELNAWRRSNEVNEREFQELRESWALAHSETTYVIPDKEKVWAGIVKNISRINPVRMYTRTILYRTAGIAAMIALLIGFSLPLLFSGKEQDSYVCFKAPAGQKAEVDLPDGTTVLLNSGSTLTYATDFSRTHRSVKVEGQAFFDVAKDTEHPFDVLAGTVKVIVHGTSFDVNSYADNPQIEVSLLSGRVSVVSASSGQLLTEMKPNEKAIIPRYEKEKCTVVACNASEESLWRLGKLKIENEELIDVIRKMERWYGVKIQLNNAPSAKRYWMTIQTESLKEMLEIINRITPIGYSINGEEVTITCR